jgi:hypothetical protein
MALSSLFLPAEPEIYMFLFSSVAVLEPHHYGIPAAPAPYVMFYIGVISFAGIPIKSDQPYLVWLIFFIALRIFCL